MWSGKAGELSLAQYVADVDSDTNTTELKRFHYHTQLIGSVTQVTDDDEVVVEEYDYGPYGEIAMFDIGSSSISASAIGNPFTYTGRRLDEESGLFYYRARHYSPQLKRFIQRDPMGYVDGPNDAAYCGGRAIRGLDPLGLKYEFQVLPNPGAEKGSGGLGMYPLPLEATTPDGALEEWNEHMRNEGRERGNEPYSRYSAKLRVKLAVDEANVHGKPNDDPVSDRPGPGNETEKCHPKERSWKAHATIPVYLVGITGYVQYPTFSDFGDDGLNAQADAFTKGAKKHEVMHWQDTVGGLNGASDPNGRIQLGSQTGVGYGSTKKEAEDAAMEDAVSGYDSASWEAIAGALAERAAIEFGKNYDDPNDKDYHNHRAAYPAPPWPGKPPRPPYKDPPK